jgi:signal transduction histidine kinase
MPDRPKGLQHTLNNPLAALLAELQLLEMEELEPAHRAGVERSIELCRRLVRIVREQVPPDA